MYKIAQMFTKYLTSVRLRTKHWKYEELNNVISATDSSYLGKTAQSGHP